MIIITSRLEERIKALRQEVMAENIQILEKATALSPINDSILKLLSPMNVLRKQVISSSRFIIGKSEV